MMFKHGTARAVAACLAFLSSLVFAQSELADSPPLPPAAIAEPVAPAIPAVQPGGATDQSDNAHSAPAAILDVTAAPTSLWQRIRNGFGLPDLTGALVREQEEWFVQRPDYIRRIVARSQRYLYHIVTELEKRGMPTELALLPIIESAYNPSAYSRSHASGLWQFIPSTGKLYGLQQNFWYDGRRDVMAATTAALDYLQKLYEQFGSWDLALASYNWGEGAVGRAIAKNQARGLPADYESLTLPPETRYYVPKLQAVKNLVANPAQYGIELAEVPNQPYFIAVTTTRHIDVKLAAKLAGMPLDEFVSLNPGHSRPVIRADGARTLLVPADKADTFVSNLESHGQPLVSWQAYTLRAGDNIARVAARHRIAPEHLKQVNGLHAKHRVGPGSLLLVPASGTAAPYLPDMPAHPVMVESVPAKAGRFTPVQPQSKMAKAAAPMPAKMAARQAAVASGPKAVNRFGGKTVKVAQTGKSTARKSAGTPARPAARVPKRIVVAQKTR